jgi:hypothetical protein
MARVGTTKKKKSPRADELSQLKKELRRSPLPKEVSAGSKHVMAHLRRSL